MSFIEFQTGENLKNLSNLLNASNDDSSDDGDMVCRCAFKIFMSLFSVVGSHSLSISHYF